VGSEFVSLVRNLVVRSYRLRDGRLRWEVLEPGVAALAIRVANDLAYVAGSTSGGSIQSFLAAYRLGDGGNEWRASALAGGVFTALAATDQAVMAEGFNLIEAHDALTGNVLWSRVVALPEEESVRRLIPIGDRTITIGTKAINPPSFLNQLVIRILDARGQVVAEDLREIGPFNSYFDAALLNDQLAVVGHIGGIAGGALVRVY
jgi:PQQ-like domain